MPHAVRQDTRSPRREGYIRQAEKNPATLKPSLTPNLGCTETQKTTKSEMVKKVMMKEIIIKVLSSLRESSANESNNVATSREITKPGKYGLVDTFAIILHEGAWPKA